MFDICMSLFRSVQTTDLTVRPARVQEEYQHNQLGKKSAVCQVHFNKFSLMFIHTYISIYVCYIENTPFFLVGVCWGFFALRGVYVTFGPRNVKKLTKKITKLQQSTSVATPPLQFLSQTCLCVLRSNITVLICLNLSVVTNS